MQRGTFVMDPAGSDAIAYICEHGRHMHECEMGDSIHQETGERMVDWYNNTFVQMQQRLVTRNRLMGAE